MGTFFLQFPWEFCTLSTSNNLPTNKVSCIMSQVDLLKVGREEEGSEPSGTAKVDDRVGGDVELRNCLFHYLH